nr:MAG TPA: hypothetical protein [Caudoviricetes sp.]
MGVDDIVAMVVTLINLVLLLVLKRLIDRT